MKELRDILQTKVNEDLYLLSVLPRNWPGRIRCGPNDYPFRAPMDESQVWFIDFLSSLDGLSQALPDIEMRAIAGDIDAAILHLRISKLEIFQVVLTSLFQMEVPVISL